MEWKDQIVDGMLPFRLRSAPKLVADALEWCLFFIEAHFQFELAATHIPGIHNDLADDLSRNQVASFLAKSGKQEANPSLVPSSLLQWLLHPDMDWTSPSWTALFNFTVPRV